MWPTRKNRLKMVENVKKAKQNTKFNAITIV